jgi:hypothetical protein
MGTLSKSRDSFSGGGWRRLEEVLEEVVWRRFSGGGKSLIDLVGPAEYLAAGEYRRPRFCWLTVI